MSLRRIQLFANNMSTTHHQNEHTVENYFGENHTGVDSWSEIGDKHEHDYTDWDYMTNGTGGCAQTGRRDVPLTASIKDGKLYCSEAWNEYAMRWDYWNLGFRWIDCQHKTFTMTVEDVERANNPQPFQHGKRWILHHSQRCMARIWGSAKAGNLGMGPQCSAKKCEGDYCKRHAKLAAQSEVPCIWKDDKKFGLFCGRFDQPIQGKDADGKWQIIWLCPEIQLQIKQDKANGDFELGENELKHKSRKSPSKNPCAQQSHVDNTPQSSEHGKDEVSPFDWENDSDCESLTYRSEDHNAYHPHSEHWEDLVDSNKQAVCELNKKMLGLKTDIRRLRFEEMVWRNQQHPLLVQKISNIFQTAKDSMGSEWKTVIDDIRMTACQKTRMIIHQLVNFFDTFAEEYDIQMKEANEILCCRLYNIQESLESPTTFEEEDWSNTDPFVLDLLQDEVNDLHIQKTTLLNKPFRIHKHLTHFLKLHQIHQNPETFMYTPLSITLDISTHSMDPNCIGESDDFSFSKLSYDAQIANVRRRIVNAENLFGLSRCEEDVPAPHELFYRLNNISDVIRQKNSTSTCDALRKGLYDYLLL